MKSQPDATQETSSAAELRHALTGESTADKPRIDSWQSVEDFDRPLAQMETVFWEPADTTSLRELIREQSLCSGKSVLEIGCGTGLLSLCALKYGASAAVATDINPAALACATFNAGELGLADRLEVRQVPLDQPAAFSVIGPNERFDLILSNPPWEDQQPDRIDDYALYDPGFGLMQSLLAGLVDHLEPGGRVYLAYGHRRAIEAILRLAPEHGLQVQVLDDREVSSLPDNFLPGMLLELTPATILGGVTNQHQASE
ncbi:MAG: class I SAM-dependent methyltransferase [Planctomycetaceae bacterium]